jgi:Ca2+/Na+ antiporter
MRLLVQIGLIELAVAALTGWAVVVWREYPQWLTRIGIVAPRRLLQLHIDYVMMGLILIAVGSVVPDLAWPFKAALIFGTIVNPLLFLPLAFGPADRRLLYRVISVISFIAMGVGLIGAAITY